MIFFCLVFLGFVCCAHSSCVKVNVTANTRNETDGKYATGPITDDSDYCEDDYAADCDTSEECYKPEVCIDGICQMDTCRGACHGNTICTIIDGEPHCSCKPGFTGSPSKGCPHKECVTSKDCDGREVCVDGKCQKDPCRGTCHGNTVCKIINGRPRCSCKPGFTGNPSEGCPYKECETSEDCDGQEVCIDGKCQKDPCRGACHGNTVCKIINGRPRCFCKPGFTGNPSEGCPYKECETSEDCDGREVCIDGKCQKDPCRGACHGNTVCKIINGRPRCFCKPGFTGNPSEGCPHKECETSENCDGQEVCIEGKCQKDPCRGACHGNTVCKIINGRPRCFCKPGFTGNPSEGCPHKEPDLTTTTTIPPPPESSKLFVGQERVNWWQAGAKCLEKDSSLVTIMSAVEQQAIEAAIQAGRQYGSPYWTSASDWDWESAKRDIKWSYNGRALWYTNWGPGEPRFTQTFHCMVLNPSTFKWQTSDCWAKHYFVCQRWE